MPAVILAGTFVTIVLRSIWAIAANQPRTSRPSKTHYLCDARPQRLSDLRFLAFRFPIARLGLPVALEFDRSLNRVTAYLALELLGELLAVEFVSHRERDFAVLVREIVICRACWSIPRYNMVVVLLLKKGG